MRVKPSGRQLALMCILLSPATKIHVSDDKDDPTTARARLSEMSDMSLSIVRCVKTWAYLTNFAQGVRGEEVLPDKVCMCMCVRVCFFFATSCWLVNRVFWNFHEGSC